jgi:hypothetical protein
MITVRFPSGFSVQYNSLNKIAWDNAGSHGAMLYGSNPDGTRNTGWSVHVPAECIVEFIRPCRTYQAASESAEAEMKQEIAALRKEIRALTRKVGK